MVSFLPCEREEREDRSSCSFRGSDDANGFQMGLICPVLHKYMVDCPPPRTDVHTNKLTCTQGSLHIQRDVCAFQLYFYLILL